MQQLCAIDGDRKSDYKFIRMLLKFMYEGEEAAKIPYRSLTGVKEGIIQKKNKTFFRNEKQPISPEKRMALQKMFKKRIERLVLAPDEASDRTKQIYINKLLKGAFGNLRSTQANEDKMIYESINDL